MAIRFKQPEKKPEVAVVVAASPHLNARSGRIEGKSDLEQVAHQPFNKREWMRLYMREYRKRVKGKK